MSETFTFQAEINQLLSLIINTFYSNKDVFLRELISNASDAIDKVRYLSLTDASILDVEDKLEIRVNFDKDAKTLTIEDTGVGMTKDDLVNNLGTIARSGTKAFMEQLQEKKDITMIGQFGVGFYAAYLVADTVQVSTKHASDDEYVWESKAGGTFTITKTETPSLTRGTRIVLHLKDDQTEFLSESKIKELVKKHNEFISYPIMLQVDREIEIDVEKTVEKTDVKAEDVEVEEKDGEIEEVDEKEEEKEEKESPVVIKEKKIVKEWETLNNQKPIWLKAHDEVTKEEYTSFYKTLTGDWDDYIAVKHFAAEGNYDFKSLLYVPKRPPAEMFDDNKKQNNIKLYVNRVFITDDSTEIIPGYLSFIKGVVDSNDLPLNISREMLQRNKIITVIKKALVKKCIECFNDLAVSDDKAAWDAFYNGYSKHIKLGVHEDEKNREKLANLLRYPTSKNTEPMTSLKDYIGRMKEGQQNIYYITGESVDVVRASPFLERLKKRGYDVLIMAEPMDEYVMQQLREFDGKKFVCVSKEGELFEETDEEKEKKVKDQEKYMGLCGQIKTILGESVLSVKVSDRITESPCVLLTDQFGWTANMERIMKAQALRESTHNHFMMNRRVMEINPDHKIMQSLLAQFETDPDSVNKDMVMLLHEAAMLSSGFSLNDPSTFVNRIHRMISMGLSLDDEEDEEEDEEDDEEDDEDDEEGEKKDEEISPMESLD